MSLSTKLLQHLKAKKLTFVVVEHRTVYTAYDLAQTLKMKLNAIAKTLLVTVHNPKKLFDDPQEAKGKHHVLTVLPAHRKLDFTKLKKLLGAQKVSIASEKDIRQVLKIKPGSQTPFGSLHGVRVVMDSALLKVQHALFSAGSFTESLRLKVKDYHQAEQPLTGDIAAKK